MSLRPCGIVILIAAAQLCSLNAQSNKNAQSAPSLREFFQALVRHDDPSSLPTNEDVLKVVDPIGSADAEEITKALPAIFVALTHPDDNVKKDAALALYVISNRADSAELLKDHVKDINSMFDLSDERLQGIPTVIYLNLKPTPPPEVVPLLIAFLKRTDRDPQAQGGAIFTLVRLASEDRDVVAAVEEFLSRPLDNSTRIGVLNALGDPSVKDVRVIAMVIASMDDPDEGVRSTAIRALMRMGNDALKQAEPALQRLAEDPQQPAEVRADAKEALQRIRPPKNWRHTLRSGPLKQVDADQQPAHPLDR